MRVSTNAMAHTLVPLRICGGAHGFYHMLEVLADPDDEEHESMLEWLGGKYDSKKFASGEVNLDSPTKRWKISFS